MHYGRQQLILDPGSYIMGTTGSFWSPAIRLRTAMISFEHQALDLGSQHLIMMETNSICGQWGDRGVPPGVLTYWARDLQQKNGRGVSAQSRAREVRVVAIA